MRHDVYIEKGRLLPLLPGMTSLDQPFADPYDEQARHWFLSEENRVVAAARLSKHAILDDIPDNDFIPIKKVQNYSGPFASMNRLVVHPDWRGRGISVLFDKIRLQAAFEMQCHTLIVCTVEKRSLHLINLHLVGEYFIMIPLLITLACMLATYIPARYASRLNISWALRHR